MKAKVVAIHPLETETQVVDRKWAADRLREARRMKSHILHDAYCYGIYAIHTGFGSFLIIDTKSQMHGHRHDYATFTRGHFI